MNRTPRTTARILIALLALMTGIVMAPTGATAQVAAGDQYQPNPPGGGGQNPDGGGGGQNPGGGGGGQNPGGGGGGGGNPGGDDDLNAGGGDGAQSPASALSPAAGSGETDAGELPFTGYPITWVLLVALILVGGGLLVKAGSAGWNRVRDSA